MPINTKKLILMFYLSCLFRLRLLSEDSYLLEGLQSADKTKTHPKAKLQNAPTFTGNGSHCHVCLLLVIKTRNSSEDEIANVNFLYVDIVHALHNTIDSCINSATYRRGYVLECRFINVSEIMQCNGHYAVQGHSRSPILVPIESSYMTSY